MTPRADTTALSPCALPAVALEGAVPIPNLLNARIDPRGRALLSFDARVADEGPPGPVHVRTARFDTGADVSIQDWDEMLSAVKLRLRRTMSAEPHMLADAHQRGGDLRVQGIVLDCVNALDQLHMTLRHELGRRQQLELEVFDAQTELAQARAELVGTQAGEKQARYLAQHDSLTSLPNRGHFMERLAVALSHAEPQRRALAVLYLDLDGFKPINDSHGHDAGDQVLRIVAARLNRALRVEDMVSRLGGDEFACLLADLPSREQLCRLACKLYDTVAAPLKVASLDLMVRPSIGIAICPVDGVTGEQLLKRADAAMYRAKRDGSGYAFFDQSAP